MSFLAWLGLGGTEVAQITAAGVKMMPGRGGPGSAELPAPTSLTDGNGTVLERSSWFLMNK